MGNDEVEALQALCAGLGAVALLATVGWLRARDRARGFAEQLHRQRQTDTEAELRRAVESMALEIERLGEGQRFMSRVLGEGTARPGTPLPAPVRHNTPH